MATSPSKKSRFRLFLRWAFIGSATLLFVTLIAGWIYVERVRASLPPLPDLSELRPEYGTRIQSQDGIYLGGEFAVEPVGYHELPPMLIAAFLAAEDEDFFRHGGYNTRSILRALFDNYRAGERVQGASTITQQVAKHFLSPEQTFQRKIQELFLAREIEAHYSKEEILSAYLGGVYFGQQAWGVTLASYRFFSVPPAELTTGQMATLAGVLPAPSVFNPIDNPRLALRERNRVLRRMRDVGILSDDEMRRLQDEPLEGPTPVQMPTAAIPEAVGTVLRAWEEIGEGRPWEASGVEVVTTHHPGHQARARQALRRGIEDHDRRIGYRGPAARVVDVEAFDQALDDGADSLFASHTVLARITAVDSEGLLLRVPGGQARIAVEDLSWINGRHPRTDRPRRRAAWQSYFSVDDVIWIRRPENTEGWTLWQWPVHEGAVLIADNFSGEVLASVGAYDVQLSRFNRAEQACRQPGSLFKTILYAEAFSQDVTAATLLSDVPTNIDARDGVWAPRNADHDFRGYLTALDAFVASRNIAAVNLFSHIGMQDLIARARRMGITSLLDPTPALALGANCTRLSEMLSVHAAVPRGGLSFERQPFAWVQNISSRSIRDYGHFLQRDPALIPRVIRAAAPLRSHDRVISSDVNHVMHRALRDVVLRGTAHAIPDEWPVSGKTGTSNEFDAWFASFDPNHTSLVWVGSDQNDLPFGPGEHGGTVALPIFADYYRGQAPALEQWPPPPLETDLEMVRIDPATGLRSRPGEPGIEYPFLRGTAPRALAPTGATRQLERFDSLMR